MSTPQKFEVSHGRRSVTVTERAGKYVLEFFIHFEDGSKEDVGGDIRRTIEGAHARARSWVNGGEK